ncbi:MAG: glycoside hydrolase family 3 C-terminal domain-containing protein [Clostridiales bacterium]|nr:glycoside hydrolase family 3 C-terminal domain-containing protein [Clostridiales bacterium]
MNEKKVKKPGKLGIVVICLLLVVTIAVNAACYIMQDTLDAYLGSQPTLTDELSEAADSLAQEIEGEGLVLLQNKDDTLPLSSDVTKVNVFGWSSTQWISGGSGSGGSSAAEVDLLGALEAAGIEYNTELTDMYTDFLSERPLYGVRTSLNSYYDDQSRLYEPSVSDTDYYSEELLANAEAYSDTAIVVFGRYTGESNDCPKVQYKQTTKDGDYVTDETRTYLDLSTEEEELLTYVGSHYENVIVLLNTTNQMSVGAIETIEGVDACILVGCTGDDGTEAVVSALYGGINPSGHLTDTYVYDLTTSSTYANSGFEGLGYYTNGDGYYPADGTTNGNVGDSPTYEGVAYVDYAESIYVGYKWYETADTEGYWDNISNEYGEGYDGVVQYPFGYGLSYTEFEWEIVDATSGELSEDGTVSVTVKVTNTGDVAGKDVVQLYYNPPYYTGGIEKSSVNLADFAKTDLLQPGESQEVTLTLDVYDMASYDCYDANNNGFTGYELDEGDYTFMVSRNAHEVVDSFTCTISQNIQYPEDPVTGAEVSNLFTGEDAVDGVSLDGSDSDANITYLTRADFEGTFPSELAEDRAMTDNVAELNLYTEEMAEAWIDEDDEAITTGADNGLSITNADGSISDLGYALGADYDNEQWDALLDQLTIDEMENMVLHAYSKTGALSSIGKIQTYELDGPTQIGSFSWGTTGKGYANPTTLAQTFNKDLAYEFGLTSGAEAVQLGLTGWYAPGVNLHRSAFGGRNYEYYSEDSYLTGVFGSLTVEGAKDTGIYTFVKHFVVYDQEAARDGVYTWMTEQTLRETYLSPFRMLVEEADCTGIMSAYNRLGAVWAGGSEALLTSVLRDEWNFQGAVLTDYADHQVYMNGDQALRAGGDLWMDGWLSDGTFMYETSSNSYQQALRRAAKDVTYMYLEAAYTAQEYAEENPDSIYVTEAHESINIWKTALIAFDVVAVLAIAACVILRVRKSKRYRAQQQTTEN